MGINTKKIKVGNIYIGGSENVIIQSMTNTKTSDVEATVTQILALENAGCELVRVTVNDMEAAKAIGEIKKRIHIPLVADIHFDYRLAIEAIENGIDKLRINPGNIGGDDKVEAVVKKAKEFGVPIRIGVNGGSLEKSILEKYGHPTAEALVESAMHHITLLEKFDFRDIIISIKASNVKVMTKAYEIITKQIEYPLHLGVTEAGTIFTGTIKSSIGIGALLLRDIGDTIRVSLTADPVEEIAVAKEILKVLEIRKDGAEIVSCPTCGRTEIDLIGLANEVEKEFKTYKENIKIAVMGCVVNGPGEAREADYGVAGGKGYGILFKKGEIVKKVEEKDILKELKLMIKEDLEKN